MTRPVLRVHGAVGHGWIEPEPISLFAVVERGLERRLRAAAASASATTAPAPAGAGLGVVIFVVVALAGCGPGSGVGFGLRLRLRFCLCLLFGALGGLGLQLLRDQRVVLRTERNAAAAVMADMIARITPGCHHAKPVAAPRPSVANGTKPEMTAAML